MKSALCDHAAARSCHLEVIQERFQELSSNVESASLVWADGDGDSSDGVDLCERGSERGCTDRETDREHAGVCAGRAAWSRYRWEWRANCTSVELGWGAAMLGQAGVDSREVCAGFGSAARRERGCISTGDLVRYDERRQAGVSWARVDEQVKVRGYPHRAGRDRSSAARARER